MRLHMPDTTKDGRGGFWGRTNVLRKMLDHLRYAPVRDVAAYRLCHATTRTHREEVLEKRKPEGRAGVKNIAQTVNRSPKEIIFGDSMQFFGEPDKPPIAFGRLRVELSGRESRHHGLGIRHQIQRRTILEK